MKTQFFLTISIAIIVLTLPVFAENSETAKVPIAFLAESIYDFGSAIEGSEVKHEFILRNNGNAPLAIERMKSSCGCTAASGVREIQPGSEEKITVTFSTRGYKDRVKQVVNIITNDKNQPNLSVSITGIVEQLMDVNPQRITLFGKVGEKIKAEIKITPMEKYNAKIRGVTLKEGEFLKYHLEEQKNENKTVYTLTIENTKKEAGRYFDTITIETDNPIKKDVVISVFGNIREQ
ncbi:MAG: DUF1573 domain-containing protein [Desulfobacterales bacterium]|nr:DUF1573 domain-containing protein [Desulfobacterales bacterium]